MRIIAIYLAVLLGSIVTPQAESASARNLRGNRQLEGECIGIEDGLWRPSPGCKGGAYCSEGLPFYLHSCGPPRYQEGFLFDEASQSCRPAEIAKCNRPWYSIGLIVNEALESDAEQNTEVTGVSEEVAEEESDEREETNTNLKLHDMLEARMCETEDEKSKFKQCKRTMCRKEDLECRENCRKESCNW